MIFLWTLCGILAWFIIMFQNLPSIKSTDTFKEKLLKIHKGWDTMDLFFIIVLCVVGPFALAISLATLKKK